MYWHQLEHLDFLLLKVWEFLHIVIHSIFRLKLEWKDVHYTIGRDLLSYLTVCETLLNEGLLSLVFLLIVAWR